MTKKEFLILFGFYSFFYILANTNSNILTPQTHTYSMPIRFPEKNTLFIYTWDNTETDLQCFPQHAVDGFHENLKEYIWTETEIENLELNKPVRTSLASLVTDVWYDVELMRPDNDHLQITFLSIKSNGPLYLVGSQFATDKKRRLQFDNWQYMESHLKSSQGKNIEDLINDVPGLREEIWDSQRQWWVWIEQNIILNTGTQEPAHTVYKRIYNSEEAQKFGDTQLQDFNIAMPR